jgi:hypothetical protein
MAVPRMVCSAYQHSDVCHCARDEPGPAKSKRRRRWMPQQATTCGILWNRPPNHSAARLHLLQRKAREWSFCQMFPSPSARLLASPWCRQSVVCVRESEPAGYEAYCRLQSADRRWHLVGSGMVTTKSPDALSFRRLLWYKARAVAVDKVARGVGDHVLRAEQICMQIICRRGANAKLATLPLPSPSATTNMRPVHSQISHTGAGNNRRIDYTLAHSGVSTVQRHCSRFFGRRIPRAEHFSDSE